MSSCGSDAPPWRESGVERRSASHQLPSCGSDDPPGFENRQCERRNCQPQCRAVGVMPHLGKIAGWMRTQCRQQCTCFPSDCLASRSTSIEKSRNPSDVPAALNCYGLLRGWIRRCAISARADCQCPWKSCPWTCCCVAYAGGSQGEVRWFAALATARTLQIFPELPRVRLAHRLRWCCPCSPCEDPLRAVVSSCLGGTDLV